MTPRARAVDFHEAAESGHQGGRSAPPHRLGRLHQTTFVLVGFATVLATAGLDARLVEAAGAAPTVTALAPESSPTGGGTTVTITGTGFLSGAGANTVDFGVKPSPTVTYVSSTELTAVSPAESPAEVYVTVSNGSGTSATGIASSFLYVQEGPYVPLSAPDRVCDTRSGTGTPCSGTAIGAQSSITLAIGGLSGDGVPASAAAAMVNLTAYGGSGGGVLTAYPSGVANPLGSDLNYGAGSATVSNLVEVPLGAAGTGGTPGAIVLFNNSTTAANASADVEGYISGTPLTVGAGLMNPLAPAERICDTRPGYTWQRDCNNYGAIASGGTLTLQVGGEGGISEVGAEAAILEVTDVATGSGTGSFTVYRQGGPVPTVPTFTFTAGATVTNRVIVPLSGFPFNHGFLGLLPGEISIQDSGQAAYAIVDADGWITNGSAVTGSDFYPSVVNRACDSRSGSGFACATSPGSLPGGSSETADSKAYSLAGQLPGGLPATGVTVVAINVTIIAPSSGGLTVVWPDGAAPPDTSDCQYQGNNTANLDVVVPLGSDGAVRIYSSAAAGVIIDLEGWYTATPQDQPMSLAAWAAAAGVGDPSASAPVAPSNVVGPVNGELGALYLTHSDITIGGRGLGLDLDRTYNSPQQAGAVDGPFGYGWSSNVAMSLAENGAGTAVTITDESGAPVTFSRVANVWVASAYSASTLTSAGGTWTYTRWDGDSYTFNSAGKLASEADRNGNTTAFGYSASQLVTMTDPSGRTLTFTWTGNNITKVEDPDGQYVTYGYDASGDLTSVTDQIGNVVGCGCAVANTATYGYDGSHHLVTQTDPLGNATTYVYSSAGQVTSVIPPAGVGGASRQTTYAYAAPASNTTTTTITAPEPNGDSAPNVTVDTYVYGLLTNQVKGEGTPYAVATTYLYDPYTLGLYLQVDSLQDTTSNSYDLNGNLLATVITSASGEVTSTSATYNSLNEPLTQTDANGNVTTDAYTAGGELCWSLTGTSTNGCGSVPAGSTSYTYGDPTNPGLPTSETDPAGEATTMSYDSQGDLATSTNAAGDETSYTYDVLSRQVTTTTPAGNAAGCGCAAANTTTTEYDPLNRVLTTTAPNGSGGWAVTVNTYDADGNLLTTEDPAGAWTTNTYDANSELCWTLVGSSPSSDPCTTAPTGATATTYDGDGNVATTTDAKGNVTTYGYNALSQKVSQTLTTSSGAMTAYTYDAHGNVLTMVSPDGNVANCGCAAEYTTTYTYDAENQLLTTTDPDGYTTTNAYDANGNLLTVTDGDGNVTTNAYNSLNQFCWTYTGAAAEQPSCGSPPSGATITTYDADRHVLTVTDGNGNVTTNAYSGTGQLCWTYLGSSGNGCSSPPAEATVYTYDANGNLLTTTKPSGQTITNAYNAANQLCWTYQGFVSNPSCGSPPTSGTYAVFTYDPDGRVLTMTDPTGTSSWTYNSQGQELTSTDGAGAEVQYGYDLNGNQTSITYPADGIVVSQAYNADNQMCWTDVSTSISGNGCSSPPAGSTVYAYDASGNLLSEDLPNGVDNTFTYDGDSNMVAISDKNQGGSTVFAATYTRNGDNMVTADGSQPAGFSEYQYTAKNQVCYAASGNSTACTSPPSGSYDYSYDLAGNLVNDNSTTQTFNSQDELCWSLTGSSSSACSSPPPGATTYSYDANGDRTATMPAAGAAATYGYNTAGQLTQYQLGSGTPTTYAYNGHGLRMSETTGSGTTAFSWSDTGTVAQLLQETTGAGTTSYVYGPTGSPIEEILPSGAAYYYSSDDLGSTRALTDASGNVQDTDTYDPYGNLTASSGSVQDHLLYAGQYLDTENGLYYLRARYYDPTTGQLLSIDPDVAITDTPYAYVIGDPVNATDASGKIPIALGGCGNPHNLAACVAAARRSGTMKGLTLKQVWTWIYSNRGMIVSVVAIGICVAAALPTAGGSLAVCGVASLVASGVRIQQRIAENGFMASLPANSADLFISSLTFGMVDTPTGLGSADVGAVGAAGLRLHSALPSIFNAATYQLERR